VRVLTYRTFRHDSDFPGTSLFRGCYDNLPTLISKIRNQQKERKIVVEAHNEEEALKATRAGTDAHQLDKLSPDGGRFRCSAMPRRSTPMSASLLPEGVNAENRVPLMPKQEPICTRQLLDVLWSPADIQWKFARGRNTVRNSRMSESSEKNISAEFTGRQDTLRLISAILCDWKKLRK
jgi:hypothetical protein